MAALKCDCPTELLQVVLNYAYRFSEDAPDIGVSGKASKFRCVIQESACNSNAFMASTLFVGKSLKSIPWIPCLFNAMIGAKRGTKTRGPAAH